MNTYEKSFGWDDATLDRAEELRAQGLSWRQVGERLGCDPNRLQVAVSRRKNGRVKGEQRRERDIIEEMVQQGKTPSEIARELGRSVQSISRTLKRMGYDKEVRDEIREEAA